jgi:glycosyltransferase involved in cell wall biosynthesis
MLSIIIPAHNEEAVIGRLLKSLTNGAEPGELEIIVVANGCNDRTAEVARAFGAPVRVIETEVGSKVHALNLGDRAATSFPRFYVDADIVLDLNALRRLAVSLERDRYLAIAPRFQMNLDGCSWFVRAFYAVNDRMPSSREGIGGSGVYGMSEQGRKRFGEFPALTADDGFVRVQFQPHERVTVEDCHSIVFAPKTPRGLVQIKTRSHFGSMQLRQRFPHLWVNRGARNGVALKRLALRPWWWARLVVYAYVKLEARRGARKLMQKQHEATWQRDDTSRASVTATPSVSTAVQ